MPGPGEESHDSHIGEMADYVGKLLSLLKPDILQFLGHFKNIIGFKCSTFGLSHHYLDD